MCSINLLLNSNVSQTIFILQVTEGQVTYSYCLPHPPGYGRTSYISRSIHSKDTLRIPTLPHPHDYGRTSYISLLSTPPTRLRKDTLHISTTHYVSLHICPTHMITEGQVTYPYCLPHPPGYGRTHYISLLSASPT